MPEAVMTHREDEVLIYACLLPYSARSGQRKRYLLLHTCTEVQPTQCNVPA